MRKHYGAAFILLRIGACISAISPSLITVHQEVSENKLSENDSRETHEDETERLCRSEQKFPAIDPNVDEDSKLRVPELIKKYNYESEVHTVNTNDGYILQMHRIPGGPQSPSQKGKTPVLLMHGLLDSSSTWVIMRPGNGLAYLLADQGYDVWLGNARGNTYSRRHVKYNPDGYRFDRKKFWSFSWHEIGVFDLPKMIDYILEKTKKSKLHYIGHSQGTTAFFVLLSQRPEYNDKIIMMNALAPVAYAKHVKSPVIRALTPFLNTLERLSSLVGAYEFLPSCELFILGGKAACRDKAITQATCENILFLIAGYSSNELNATMLPVILGHTPAGASAMQLVHYGQEVRSDHFRRFDYGLIQNWIHYKTFTAPDYNLQNVKVKVAIYYSISDSLAVMADVQRLARELPNLVGANLVEHESFNHVDFVWAINAPRLLYNPIINALNSADETNGQN